MVSDHYRLAESSGNGNERSINTGAFIEGNCFGDSPGYATLRDTRTFVRLDGNQDARRLLDRLSMGHIIEPVIRNHPQGGRQKQWDPAGLSVLIMNFRFTGWEVLSVLGLLSPANI